MHIAQGHYTVDFCIVEHCVAHVRRTRICDMIGCAYCIVNRVNVAHDTKDCDIVDCDTAIHHTVKIEIV